jgi:hypothetical protein
LKDLKKEVPVTIKEWKKGLFIWVIGPTLLALTSYGCAAVDHTHPDLAVDMKAVEAAASKAESAANRAEAAASKADGAASKANAAASRAEAAAGKAEGAARRAEASATKAERAANKAEAIFKKTLRK